MTSMQIISLALSTSIVLLVFGLGLNARPRDLTWLFRRPGLLVRSILSMNVFMVLVAVAIAFIFHVAPEVKIAIVALALSPVPPILPNKQHKAGGDNSYAIGLMTAAALLAIFLVPGWLVLLGSYFGFETHLAVNKILPIVLGKVVAPLLVGTLIAKFAPSFATRIAKPVSIVATVLLVLAVLPVLFVSWHAMWAMIGNGVLIAMAVFALVGIAMGHVLGGSDTPHTRSVLALATSTRHPGIALAIATLNFPERGKAILIVILFHLIVSTIVALPYVKWSSARAAKLAPPPGA